MKINIIIAGLITIMLLSGCSLKTTSKDDGISDNSKINQQEPSSSVNKGGSATTRTRMDFSNDEKFNIHMCLMGGGEGCDTILDTNNKATYADAILEQCEIMVGMEVCETYFGSKTDDSIEGDRFNVNPNDSYSRKKKQEIIQLNDGESYSITLENITQTIDDKEVRMMAYNGSIPGPLIKVNQGSRIILNVTNNIEDIESSVHHHGLRLQDSQDGVPVSMGGWDIPMKVGDTNSYTLDFPDPGIYWYHPHVREDLQQELGMYGNYLVTPNDETYRNTVDAEELLVLDDIQLDEAGISPFYKDYTNQAIMGRFGTHYLINGSEKYSLNIAQGEVTRVYVTNTANVRPFNISIPGISMKLVGSDLGAYEKETIIDSLLIAPAERYIIELYAPDAGAFELQFINPSFTKTLGEIIVTPSETISLAGQTFETVRSVSQVITDIDQYRNFFDKPIDKTLRLDMTLNGKTKDDLSLKMAHNDSNPMSAKMGGLTYDLTDLEREDEMFEMNEGSTDETTKWQLIDEKTGKVSMEIDDWMFTQGDVIKVRITNDGEGLHPMQHPIHFHGQRFLVINKNGIPNDNMVWKDTVLTLPGEYIDILIDMSNPGKWMAHCHIAEHMHAGMMFNFSVKPSATNNAINQ